MKLHAHILAILLMAAPLSAAPDELDNAHQSLKEAVQSKKDAADVKKLAVEAHALAHQLTSAIAPDNEALKETLARGREVESYSEYALYATALQGPADVTVDLLSTLEQMSPKSKYLDEGYSQYFIALHRTGAGSKIPALAEKAIANFPNNVDLLMVLADLALERKQYDRAVSYGLRVVAASQRAKPEGMSAADWDRKRTTAMGRGHWTAGIASAVSGKYGVADKELRAALPLIKGNEEMTGNALFYLGLANYQIGKMTLKKALMLEGVKFSEQAAAMKCSMAQAAFKNARLIKLEADRMR